MLDDDDQDTSDGKCRDDSPDEDVGRSPAGCVGAEEDRQGDVPEDNSGEKYRYGNVHYGPSHVTSFESLFLESKLFKHFNHPLQCVW